MGPKTIFWEITKKCNLVCGHCYLGSKPKAEYCFSKNQSLHYVDLMCGGGIKTVLFMGGEPILYPHIYEVVKKASENQLHAGILTNGALLDDCTIAKLRKSNVSAVQVSIDGTGAIYKKIRGIPFSVVREGIKKLQKNKIPVKAKFTLNNVNVNNFGAVWSYCQKNDIGLSTSLAIQIGNAEKNIVLNPKQYFTAFKKMLALKKTAKLNGKGFSLPDFSIEEYLENGSPQTGCDAGRGVAGITTDNKFVPCIYLSGMDVHRIFGINPPEFDDNFLEVFEKHPLFVLFRNESAEQFGCPIRRKIYKGNDFFSVYEFAKFTEKN